MHVSVAYNPARSGPGLGKKRGFDGYQFNAAMFPRDLNEAARGVALQQLFAARRRSPSCHSGGR